MKISSMKTPILLFGVAVLVLGIAVTLFGRGEASPATPMPSASSLADGGASPNAEIGIRTRQLISDSHRSLNPEQEQVKYAALSALPAPCCSNYSAYTCCCTCNLTKSIWGLANRLILDEGLGATEVREEVQAWIAKVNPDGFSGDACFTSRCHKPFHDNGCGGMTESQLALD